MVVEIAASWAFGSMALLADGLHMGPHASALTISAFAYFYTRRHAKDRRFTFGTGKINSLAAFASAVPLLVFALIMAWESAKSRGIQTLAFPTCTCLDDRARHLRRRNSLGCVRTPPGRILRPAGETPPAPGPT